MKEIQQLHDRRALALRFLCDNSNKSDIRTNLKGIKFGGVSAAHVRPLLSYEISVISLFIILVSFFLVVIAEICLLKLSPGIYSFQFVMEAINARQP